MNHTEHLGIAFANILYAFLANTDCGEHDSSVQRFFERRSREKQSLVALLMKKGLRHAAFQKDIEDAEESDARRVTGREGREAAQGDDKREVCRGNFSGGSGVREAPVDAHASLLERSLTTDSVVTQLTVVRNAFLENLLRSQQHQLAPFRCASGSVSSTSSSFSFGHVTLRQIPVVSSGALTDSEVKTIEAVVSSLCDKLRQTCSSRHIAWLTMASGRGTVGDSSDHHNLSCSELLADAVEAVWAFSLCLTLAPQDSLFIRSGEYVYCGKVFLQNRCINSSIGLTKCSSPRLADSPPVFFLSQNLATSLELHFHDVLLNMGSSRMPPSGLYHLLLSRSCYEVIGQLHDMDSHKPWREYLRTCAWMIKTARLSSCIWENVQWESLVAETSLTLSSTQRTSLVTDLDFIWRHRQLYCGEHSDDSSRVIDVAWDESLPCFLAERSPVNLTSHFGLTAAALVSAMSAPSKGNNNRGEKIAGEAFNPLMRYTLHLCHVFNHHSGSEGMLMELLELIRKMVGFSKKDKRLRAVVTLTLSGCLFSRPASCGANSGNCSGTQQQEPSSSQLVAEKLLDDVEVWRKSTHTIWYSFSVSVLLGLCSTETLAQRLPSFFKTLGSWFISSDSMDRIAILHSTLHAGGLLCDICSNHAFPVTRKFGESIEKFFQCVEKMLLRGLGSENWRESPRSFSTVAAASDLLIFSLQRGPFQAGACHWLVKLLHTKSKTRSTMKGGSSASITCGQLIAIRTLSAIKSRQYSPCHHPIPGRKELATGNSISVIEDDKSLATLYQNLFDPKASVREKIVGCISVYRSCYSPVITTIEGLSVFWCNEDLESIQKFLKSTTGFQVWIEDVRKAAVEYLQHVGTDGHTENSLDCTLHLIHVFLVARFWVPLHVMLDKSLIFPMLLVGPKTPLYEVVSRIVMPFYLLGKSGGGMMGCALALHRLAECIVVSLGNDEDDHVEHLTEYVTSHLLVLRDRMQRLVNSELHAIKHGENVFQMPESCQGFDPCDRDGYHRRATNSRQVKWDWLLNAIHGDALQGKDSTCTSPDAQDWCAIPALYGTALIDILEGLSVVLLGHTRRQVRRMALMQLDILASLISLQKLDFDAPSRERDDPLTATAQHTLQGGIAMSFHHKNPMSSYDGDTKLPRLMIADIFKELGEHFDKMYTSQKTRYVSLAAHSDSRACSTQHLASDGGNAMGARTLGLETSLSSTSFGLHSMTEDGVTPLFVFVATTALALMMYGYCQKSAAVRAASVIAGEVVDRGAKKYMEQNSPLWASCYALNLILLLVDNAKTSPDANRLTRGSEHNRPGHQQGGNTSCDATWQIMNRHARYQHLMNDVTMPLLLREIENDSTVSQFLDMMQYLLGGPLEFASAGGGSLVIISGMVSYEHLIVTRLREILSGCNSKTRRGKRHVAQVTLIILLPMLIIICRRHFLNPPIVLGQLQDCVATKRAGMEVLLQDTIGPILLGDLSYRECDGNIEGKGNFSTDLLGRILSEGNGVSTQSWLTLPCFSSVITLSEDGDRVNHEMISEITLSILLRGVFSDLIAVLYSKDAKYLEPRFKKKLLPKVLHSLTYQAQWFMKVCLKYQEMDVKCPHHVALAMEKCILALQTVVSSLEQPASGRLHSDHAKVISSFSKVFFKWLQRALPTDCVNFENTSPGIFGLAVTLLVADSPSREAVRVVLSEQCIGAPVHRTLFSMMVTALSAMWAGLREPLLLRRSLSKLESYTRSEVSSDTFSVSIGTSFRGDSVIAELATTGSPIFFALAYLYEGDAVDRVFDSTVRSKAQILLQLLCGEAPNDTMTDPLDDWLCLLLKVYRQGSAELENDNKLIQSLFETVSDRILSVNHKEPSPTHLQHITLKITLKILTLLVRLVEATEANLRTALQVTLACQNSTSDQVIAALWGGWIAYEGRERKRFVSALVSSSMDLADKCIVTNYLDSYISYELTLQGKGRGGNLDRHPHGAYYSFFFFALYQMKLLRHNVMFTLSSNKGKCEGIPADGAMDIMLDDECRRSSTVRGSRSFIHNESQANLGIGLTGARKKRRVLWVLDENIWRSSLKLTQENLRKRLWNHVNAEKCTEFGFSDIGNGFSWNSATVQEASFVKPLVSVLFFASWAVERLRKRGGRLWKELQRDLGFVTNFMMRGVSNSRRSDVDLTSSSDSDEENMGDSSESKGIDEYATSATDYGDSDSQKMSLMRYETTTSAFLAAPAGKRAPQPSESDSENTVLIHEDIPETSFAEVVALNMKREKRLKKRAGSNGSGTANPNSSSLQRDILAMLLHLTCMLLVHLGCGEMRCKEDGVELSSWFHVVELSIEALSSLLRDAASEESYYASGNIKNWLKITLMRLRQRECMMPCAKNEDGDRIPGNPALIFEPTLMFEDVVSNGWWSNLPSSSANIFLSELFLSIAGHGRNVKGRRFLLRCLHESSTWLQCEAEDEKRTCLHLHTLHSYIALLSMKVARSISHCLTFTTGARILGRNWRQMWMEKTATQLAEANMFRQLLTALSCRITDFRINTTSTTLNESSMNSYDHILCTSILTSLGCLLRDIIVHETYYYAGAHKWESEEMKYEPLMLATPFGESSAFPTRYLVSCFWIGFAFLLASDTWSAACNLLAVFHRHGCTNFLGTIVIPNSLIPLKQMGMSVTADRIAVQLVLFRQGRTAKVRHGAGYTASLCSTGQGFGDTTGAVLNYLSEYATDREDSALFLAFSELLLLCDWNSLDLEAYTPLFSALSGKGQEDGPKSGLHSTLAAQRDSVASSPSAFHSFSQCLFCLAAAWKQSLVMYSNGFEGTSQSLSSCMAFVLRKLFLMAVKAFDVSSIDVLLHRAVRTGSEVGDAIGGTVKHWGVQNKDACPPHNPADASKEQPCMGNRNVLLFQNLFESLVMLPLMSLFRSSQTPLLLWSKILALVAALLQYHEEGHDFVTDLLQKFLQYLERGLNVGTTYNYFTDETPLFDRLVVPVLAEEVSAKVRNLRALRKKRTSSAPSHESMKSHPLLESILDNKVLVATIVDHFVKDSAFITPVTPTAQNTATTTETLTTSSLTNVPSSLGFSPESCIHDNHGMKTNASTVPRSPSPCSIELDRSFSGVQCTVRGDSGYVSHRFGVYAYDVPTESNVAAQLLVQLPLECYRIPPKEELDSLTSTQKSISNDANSSGKDVDDALLVKQYQNRTGTEMSHFKDFPYGFIGACDTTTATTTNITTMTSTTLAGSTLSDDDDDDDDDNNNSLSFAP